MLINRQKFAMNIGLLIMSFHIILSFLLWFILDLNPSPNDPERVIAKEITTPVTVGYAFAILKYFLDNDGIVTSARNIGGPLALLIGGLIFCFCSSLLIAPVIYAFPQYNFLGRDIYPGNLNSFFLVIESTFGGLIALIMSYLYGNDTEPQPINGSP